MTALHDDWEDPVGQSPSMLSEAELEGITVRMRDAGVDIAEPLTSVVIAGGRSNLTFRLTDGRTRWAMRTPPRTGRTPSAHDVAREFQVTRALHRTDVPVPRPVLLCEDNSVIGGPFAIAEFVDGVTVQSVTDLARLDDATVDALARTLVTTLATLHRVDYQAVGLGEFGRPGGYSSRQLRRWSSQWETVCQPTWNTAAEKLLAGLAADVPEQVRTAIVHGDFRIDNTLLTIANDPASVEVAAVVDWELCTIGAPVADVAMMCAYRNPAFDLILGEESAWTSDRLPDASTLASAYEQASATTLANWSFHLALAYFKIAVIAAGIDYRYRRGSGSGPGFDSSAEAVAPYLEAGLAALKDQR